MSSTSPSFERLDAGIVLQAYLPDSLDVARSLGEWANRRRARGGGRLKVRLVKGANLAMEKVEAEMHGWPPASYGSKHEVDANYKAVLDVLLRPDLRPERSDRSREPQSLRRCLGHRPASGAAGSGPTRTHRDRDARGHGSGPGCRGPTPRRRSAPLHAPRRTPGLPLGDRLPRAPTRREHLAENFLAHLFDLAADPAVFDDQAAWFAASVRDRPHRGRHPSPGASRIARHRDHAGLGAVRQRARHGLDAPRQPALDHRRPRRATRSLTGRARPSDDRRRRHGSEPRRRSVRGLECRRRKRESRDHQPSRRRLRRRIAGRSSPRWSPTRTSRSPRATRRCPRRSTSLATTPAPRSPRRRHGCQTCSPGCGRRRATVELPARHPRGRRPRRARRWEPRHPQARAPEPARPRELSRRCAGPRESTATSSRSSRPTTTTPGAGSSPIPTSPR